MLEDILNLFRKKPVVDIDSVRVDFLRFYGAMYQLNEVYSSKKDSLQQVYLIERGINYLTNAMASGKTVDSFLKQKNVVNVSLTDELNSLWAIFEAQKRFSNADLKTEEIVINRLLDYTTKACEVFGVKMFEVGKKKCEANEGESKIIGKNDDSNIPRDDDSFLENRVIVYHFNEGFSVLRKGGIKLYSDLKIIEDSQRNKFISYDGKEHVFSFVTSEGYLTLKINKEGEVFNNYKVPELFKDYTFIPAQIASIGNNKFIAYAKKKMYLLENGKVSNEKNSDERMNFEFIKTIRGKVYLWNYKGEVYSLDPLNLDYKLLMKDQSYIIKDVLDTGNTFVALGVYGVQKNVLDPNKSSRCIKPTGDYTTAVSLCSVVNNGEKLYYATKNSILCDNENGVKNLLHITHPFFGEQLSGIQKVGKNIWIFASNGTIYETDFTRLDKSFGDVRKIEDLVNDKKIKRLFRLPYPQPYNVDGYKYPTVIEFR